MLTESNVEQIIGAVTENASAIDGIVGAVLSTFRGKSRRAIPAVECGQCPAYYKDGG